ncbi:MAG: IclR family transcriptional regulator [Acidimicrobiia bacterium]|nr:IclR family transcriptional regulator [Acidimicrobiia bacterium]MYE72495.1 IclR family transcriptional regulator [Acidimicrobiia bacterium]MYJ62772.1 IclR family transcriptional regulator [Acidimicrobiia bacterium]
MGRSSLWLRPSSDPGTLPIGPESLRSIRRAMSQTVQRAIQVLGLIGENPSSIEQVASFMGTHRSTALRTLQVLEAEQMVVRDSHNVFRLGRRVISLANAALENIDLRSVAAPFLTQLSHEVEHTIHLAMLEGDTVVYIDKREAKQAVRMYSRIGNTAPLHCTGVAKAIVAFLPLEDQQRIASGIDFVAHTDNTLANTDDYLADLRAIVERGYAIDHLEHEPWVNCIAAPVFEASGQVTGSVSITTTTLSCDYETLLTMVPQLFEASFGISREFGWTGNGPGNDQG